MKMHFDLNNPKVIDELFKNNYFKWILYAKNIIGDLEDARDIVSDSLIKLMEQKHNEFNNMYHVQGYFYAVVRNSCKDYLRRDKFRTKVKDNFRKKTPLSENVIVRKYEKTELLQLLYKRINDLPPKMRRTFTMTYLHGYNRSEVAKFLNVSENTIRNTNAVAMKTIRIAFGNV